MIWTEKLNTGRRGTESVPWNSDLSNRWTFVSQQMDLFLLYRKKKKKKENLRGRATPAGSFLFFSSLLEGMRKQLVAGLLLLKTHLFCGCVCVDPDMVDTGWGRVGAFPVWLLLVLRTILEENLRAFPSVFSPRTYGLTALLHSHPLLFTDRFFPSEDARAS